MDYFYLYAIAYFSGSIPFGLLFVKMAGKGDIRNIGSGNIGTTNVMRTGSKKLAAITLLADGAKGMLPVIITKHLAFDATTQCLVAGVAILGHIFPIWLKFKGGKGVATALGVYLVLCPIVGLLTFLTWGLSAKLTRISSLSALIAFFMAPIYTVFLMSDTHIIIFTMSVYFLIAWTHRENIKRLLSKQEGCF